jgi:hypothetical protein
MEACRHLVVSTVKRHSCILQYNINVPIELSEANTNKMRVIARLKHKMF